MIGPLRGRRRVVMAAAAAVALLAGVLTGVQIRAAQAAQAAERREDAAASEDAAAAEAELEADQEAARVARVDVVLSWASAAQAARPALVAAEAALVASEAEVADDAVRQALAGIVTALHAALDDPPDTPTDDDVATLADLTAQAVPATTLVTDAQAAWQAEQDAAAAAAAATGQPRSSARGWPYDGAAPDCGSPESYEPSQGGTLHTSIPTETGTGSNGDLPRSAMTPLPWCTDALGNQQWLRTDAAEAMVRLNDAFRAQFGENIAIDLSYRSYADQVAFRAALGSIAARPGTSNHGWGLAIDTWEWDAYDFGTPRYQWLVANGPTYGWISPSAQDSSNPEYWHFEYTG